MLILFDIYLWRNSFHAVDQKVRCYPLCAKLSSPDALRRWCYAVDMACIWYWKEVLCLQRSAATTCLLRQNGVPAEMIIGAQQVPFKQHAWVEVDGQVVNDKPYMRELWAV
jgi:hypothetical protein